MDRVLVTGASGFLGTYIVKNLLQKGDFVHGITRQKPLLISSPKLQAHQIDITDTYHLEKVLQAHSISKIIHCAAAGVLPPADQDVQLNRRVNFEASTKLVEIAEKNKVQQFTHIGSCFEYGNLDLPTIPETAKVHPTSAYGTSKAEATQHLQQLAPSLSMRVCILRPFGIWGPGEAVTRLVPAILAAKKADRPLALTPGDQLRDFSYVADVADWIVKLASTSIPQGAVINLGSGVGKTVRQFASEVAEIWGCKHLLQFGAIPYRSNEMMRLVADVSKLHSLLPDKKTSSLIEGLKMFMVETERSKV